MGILSRAGLAATLLASCYSPDVRDCTVSCAAETECATGQVCGSDGFCARPAYAGSCLARLHDAGVTTGDGGPDAPHDSGTAPHDAPNQPPMPDAAPAHVTLHIEISGHGRVTTGGYGACDFVAPQNGSCMIDVPRGAVVTLTAVAAVDWMFDSWTSGPCIGVAINLCTFTANQAEVIGVKFKKDN